jgi:hypothetical protein
MQTGVIEMSILIAHIFLWTNTINDLQVGTQTWSLWEDTPPVKTSIFTPLKFSERTIIVKQGA